MKIVDEFIEEVKKYGAYKLSKKVDITFSTINNWMKGKGCPSLENAQMCADAMGLEFLLFDKL